MYKLVVIYVLYVYYVCHYYAYEPFTDSPHVLNLHDAIQSVMITHRESYAFDTDCKFCAQESPLVAQVNTRVCPECFSWLSEYVGLANVGIQRVAE